MCLQFILNFTNPFHKKLHVSSACPFNVLCSLAILGYNWLPGLILNFLLPCWVFFFDDKNGAGNPLSVDFRLKIFIFVKMISHVLVGWRFKWMNLKTYEYSPIKENVSLTFFKRKRLKIQDQSFSARSSVKKMVRTLWSLKTIMNCLWLQCLMFHVLFQLSTSFELWDSKLKMR